MELAELFKRVNELTCKYPKLSKAEIYELKRLSKTISAECSNAIYDMSIEEKYARDNE